jgi:hypothetical protein
LEEGIEFHRAAGLPGGDETVTVLYLAVLGLLLEHLTLPGVPDGVLPGVAVPDELLERIVATIVPEGPGPESQVLEGVSPGPIRPPARAAARATSATSADRSADRGAAR